MKKTLTLSLLLALVFCIPAVSKTTTAGMSSAILSTVLPPPARDGLLDQTPASILSTDVGVGPNRVLLQPDGKILAGGNFSVSRGLICNGITRLMPDGTTDTSFNTVLNAGAAIGDMAIQPDGKILIAGNFSSVNGAARPDLARLNPDGSLDTTFAAVTVGVGSTDSVAEMALLADGRVVIGGSFSTINGVTHTRIARVNSDGTLDATFTTAVNSFWSGPFSVITQQADGKIYICGRFHSVNGTSRANIARLNLDGTLDTSFNSPGFTSNSFIDCFVLLTDGKILVGSFFGYTVGGQSRTGIARLNNDGSIDTSFAGTVGFNDWVRSICVLSDGRIMIGGTFDEVDGVPRQNLAILNANGNLESFTIATNVNDSVTNILQQPDGKVLIGGPIRTLANTRRDDLARIDVAGNLEAGFEPDFGSFGSIISSVLQADGKIVVAGQFDRVNGFRSPKVARINPDGTTDQSFIADIKFIISVDQETDPSVLEIVSAPGNKFLIGGSFNRVGGLVRNKLARLNSDGTVDPTLDLGPTGTSGEIEVITLQPDGKIFIGGGFNALNGSEQLGIARLNSDGTKDVTFTCGINVGFSQFGALRTIVLEAGGKILVGGEFSNVNGTARNQIAKLNPDGSLDPTFVPPPPQPGISIGVVKSMLSLPDGKVVTGYSGISNFDSPYVRRFLADGTLDTTFSTGNIGNQLGNEGIYDMVLLPDGKILIAGTFANINGVGRGNIARLTKNGRLDYSFESKNVLASVTHILRQPDGNLIITGSFQQISGQQRSGVGRLLINSFTRQPFFDFDGDNRADISVYRPSDGTWYRLDSQNNAFSAIRFGLAADRTAPADYDSDGRTDTAVFRDGMWYILNSTDFSFRAENFGLANDIALPSDYDGDGVVDIVVFRPSDGNWYILGSRDGFLAYHFGVNGDRPLIADQDNDGRSEITVWRPTDGVWYSLNLANGNFQGVQFGADGDIPVPADFDADGKTDIGVYRPTTGYWYLSQSTNGLLFVPFGIAEDIPAPGDYDGDGKADIGVWRPSVGDWFLLKSTAGFQGIHFGLNGDKPVPASFIR